MATFDIEPAMAERTRQRAAQAGVSNVVYVVDDGFAHGFGGEPASKDACLLFKIREKLSYCIPIGSRV